LHNMRDFLSLSNVAMVGGSWLTPPSLMREAQWKRITELAHEAVAASLEKI
jgi:2-dehydro-3-deoxyphosphogluconate aldolase / (4S)-4-hydroxy-2-oxoglutarate aldolase